MPCAIGSPVTETEGVTSEPWLLLYYTCVVWEGTPLLLCGCESCPKDCIDTKMAPYFALILTMRADGKEVPLLCGHEKSSAIGTMTSVGKEWSLLLDPKS